jgi:hypothetical protein
MEHEQIVESIRIFLPVLLESDPFWSKRNDLPVCPCASKRFRSRNSAVLDSGLGRIALRTTPKSLIYVILNALAGAGGFEPPDGGIKIRCLTTWLRPNASQGSNGLGGKRADNSSGCPAPQWPSRTKFAPAEGSPHTPNALKPGAMAWVAWRGRSVLKGPDFASPLRGAQSQWAWPV